MTLPVTPLPKQCLTVSDSNITTSATQEVEATLSSPMSSRPQMAYSPIFNTIPTATRNPSQFPLRSKTGFLPISRTLRWRPTGGSNCWNLCASTVGCRVRRMCNESWCRISTGSRVRILTLLQDRLAGVAHNCSARGIAQANQFMPAGRFGMFAGGARRLRIDRRVNRDGDTGRPRQASAIAQKTASPGQGHRYDGHARGDGRLEGAKLERPHAILFSESAFRKNKNGFAVSQKLFHLLCLAQSRLRISAVKLQVPHLFQECADKRHSADFHFRDEAVSHAQPEHQRQHVEVTRVVRRIDFCAGRIHVLLADDTHRATYEREQDLESGRGEASCFLLILDELHYHPGGNNPKQKHDAKVQTI